MSHNLTTTREAPITIKIMLDVKLPLARLQEVLEKEGVTAQRDLAVDIRERSVMEEVVHWWPMHWRFEHTRRKEMSWTVEDGAWWLRRSRRLKMGGLCRRWSRSTGIAAGNGAGMRVREAAFLLHMVIFSKENGRENPFPSLQKMKQLRLLERSHSF
ncbi:hypothetical protein U1Q18_017691 [Sarracenia purpurea var. burkii]